MHGRTRDHVAVSQVAESLNAFNPAPAPLKLEPVRFCFFQIVKERLQPRVGTLSTAHRMRCREDSLDRSAFALRATADSLRVRGLASSGCGAAEAGGGERDRTDDLLLAKQALSQLSYTPLARHHARLRPSGYGGHQPSPMPGEASRSRVSGEGWWVWLDSNQRPPPYQDGALTG